MNGFIMLNRGAATVELLQDPKAWTLLSLIAMRARWSEDTISIHELRPGQAFLGDCKSCGLSQKEYVTAKKRLEKWGLVSFKGTNKGTIATLLSRSIYDIFGKPKDKQETDQGTTGRQTGGKPAATNENGTKKRTLKPKDNGRGKDSPRIRINNYDDIMGNEYPPVTVACAVTGDYLNSAAGGFFNNAQKQIGDDRFRQAVAELWSEMKCDNIRKPGAILTNKLKKLMGIAQEVK